MRCDLSLPGLILFQYSIICDYILVGSMQILREFQMFRFGVH